MTTLTNEQKYTVADKLYRAFEINSAFFDQTSNTQFGIIINMPFSNKGKTSCIGKLNITDDDRSHITNLVLKKILPETIVDVDLDI